VAGFDLVMYSHDGGINWESSRGKTAPDGYLPVREQVYSLAVGHQDPMLVYAATQKGVFRSLDGGGTWQPLDKDESDNFIEDPIYTVAIDPTSSDKAVYAAGLGDRILYNTENANDQRKFKWKIEVCQRCRSAIYALTFDPDGTGFAGSTEGILTKKNADSQVWVLNDPPIAPPKALNLIISNLVIDPSDPGVIYAGTGWRLNPMALGLYRSQNGGATWQQMNEGLPPHENPAPYVQGIAAAKDGALFIATHDGVYQRNDEGKWEKE
jgi:hypothetical protein